MISDFNHPTNSIKYIEGTDNVVAALNDNVKLGGSFFAFSVEKLR